MSVARRKRAEAILITIDRNLGNQKSNANKSLNAFISEAGHRPGFDQEIQEFLARSQNRNL